MKHIIVSFLFALLLVGCSSEDLHGKWKAPEERDGSVEFKKNGEIVFYDQNGKSDGKKRTFEAITDTDPKQIHYSEDSDEKIPLGIYKLEDGKLFIEEVKVSLNRGKDADTRRHNYEMPTEFSERAQEFTRSK